MTRRVRVEAALYGGWRVMEGTMPLAVFTQWRDAVDWAFREVGG